MCVHDHGDDPAGEHADRHDGPDLRDGHQLPEGVVQTGRWGSLTRTVSGVQKRDCQRAASREPGLHRGQNSASDPL